MTEAAQTGPAAGVVADLVAAMDGDLLAVLPRPEAVQTLTEAVDEADFAHSIRLLTNEATAKQIRQDFLPATHLVDHINAGTIEVRTIADAGEPRHTLLVGPEQTVTLVWPPGDTVGATLTDSGEFRTTVSEPYETMWANAEEFSFQTPGYSCLLETLEDRFDTDLRADVEQAVTAAVLEQAQAASLDEVHVLLLVAATYGEELFELSRWGEWIGLASAAKFSQRKQDLEERGVIDTEKIPQERGRPRQRLVLNPDHADTQTVEDLISAL